MAPHIGKIKGLEAAERRVAKQQLMGKGGKLGAGPGSRVGKSMRQVVLEVRESWICAINKSTHVAEMWLVSHQRLPKED